MWLYIFAKMSGLYDNFFATLLGTSHFDEKKFVILGNFIECDCTCLMLVVSGTDVCQECFTRKMFFVMDVIPDTQQP